ncbi:MAG TPA: PLP-dependent aminotransferase family protein [Terriglobales bacterium]|jgi:GntR family transcriptional regulator/MocR family aminotransferase|nr:PLP-dependent aminotransferase family protein [Terriglobales bacterium]
MKKISSGISPIICIDRKAPKALHEQIYDAYRTAIIDRSLRAGQRVPSTRMLAGELGISRIPILNAYAQLLAEGYFEGRVGAGTVVSKSLPDQVTPIRLRTVPSSKKAPRGPRVLSKRSSLLSPFNNVAWSRGWGPFGVSQVAFDQFPFRIWNSLVTRHCRKVRAESLDYGSPMGSIDLREAVAAYLRTARGVRCEADHIIIVSGSQQALEISTRVLLDPGSSVWMEEPGYRLARSVFAFNGCQIVPVPVDSEGLNVAAGVKQCPNARAAFVSPSHQYPLGVTMSASRRLQLLDWAEGSGSWIIEDDYDSEYRYENMPIPSLQGLDSNSRVIYIGTFSKVLFPSLRLGYIVLPPDLVERFLAARLAMDISPAGFHQAVLADFIREGHFSRHIRRMRLLYGKRRSVLIESIRKQLGLAAEVVGGQAGMHLSLTVKGIDDREIAERAASQRLWLVPLSSSYLRKPARQGFILGFGSTGVEQIPDAVSKLGALLRPN